MREIPLSQGKIALVDDEDFEPLNRFKWYALRGGNTFYALRATPRMKGKKRYKIHMHRFILGVPKGLLTDHIDGNGLNNQRSNIRIVNHRQNCQNRRDRKRSSKCPGVSWHPNNHNWVSRITINGRTWHLGSFAEEIDAATAYRVAEKCLVAP